MRLQLFQPARFVEAPAFARLRTWRAMALLELGKGCMALAGIALVTSGLGQWLLHMVHMRRAQHFVAEWSRSPHGLLLAIAAGYAALRFTEAVGLWRGRPWARWTSMAGYFAYIPVELWQLAHGASRWLLAVLALSVTIVCTLAMQPLPGRSAR